MIYDFALDPTGVFLVTAESDGVRIYNIDASTFTANTEHPLNPDDLRHRIDLNGDGKEDRLLAFVPLGEAALGVDT